MASHGVHDSPARLRNQAEPILYDGCDRCAEHADDPLVALDPEFTEALWNRMVEVERNDGAYSSGAEARACKTLYRIAVWLERHSGIDPWRWPLAPRANAVR